MITSKQKIGEKGEKLACKLYKSQGHKILYRNLSTRFGEVDLVTEKGGIQYLIEIKVLSSNSYGTAFEKWNSGQRQRLSAAARLLIAKGIISNPEKIKCEFIAFDISYSSKVKFVRHENISLNIL